MLDTATKRRIDTARDILVGKVPDPKSQVEQITIALIYKFMDDMDAQSEELGGKRTFFADDYARYGWPKLMRSGLGGHEVLALYSEAITKMPENPGIPLLFRDIFKNAYLPYRDPETLKGFLKVIDEFEYDHSERLGDAFEYLLSVLGSQGDAGQFRTPRHIIDFMVELIDPKKDEVVLDRACGTAGFLISSYKHICQANKDADGNDQLTPDKREKHSAGEKSATPSKDDDASAPDESIETAYNQLNESLSDELLETMHEMNPYKFEQLVVDLLFAMGYGGSREEAAQVTQKSNDGGIDGIINEDRLGARRHLHSGETLPIDHWQKRDSKFRRRNRRQTGEQRCLHHHQ